MATFNVSTLAKQPKSQPQGVLTKVISVSNVTEGVQLPAAANIVNLIGIPYGATLIHVREKHTSDATTFALSLGTTGGTATDFFNAQAKGTSLNSNVANLPFRIIGADTDVLRYRTLYATATPSALTTTWSIDIIVEYTMDE